MDHFLDPHSAGEQAHGHEEQLQHGEYGPASPALEAVLETECVALLALEASLARMRFLPGDHERADADIGGAIDLLRHAMAELRARLGVSPPSLLALGFVVPGGDLVRTELPYPG